MIYSISRSSPKYVTLTPT